MKAQQLYNIGDFQVIPFEAKHDVPCFGFLIKHEECGVVCFLTDSYYSPYKFDGVNNWIVEANYSKKIINEKFISNGINPYIRNRIIKSHLSLESCIDLLKANDLSKTNNIVLIHLSDSNSDERMFKSEVEKATYKNVFVARNGMELDFNKEAF